MLGGIVLLAAGPWGGAGGGDRPVVIVLAAASLTDALEAALAAWDAPNRPAVRVDYGSSGALAMKILRGAPADVYFPASVPDMDRLADAGRIDPATRREVLGNTLVCVVPAAAPAGPAGPADLPADRIRRVALADPAHAPAGRYARDALRHLGLWERLAGRLVTCDNVRAALAQAEAGAVDAAIVYRSDAATTPRVREAFAFPPGSCGPIVYPVAVLRGAARPGEAAAVAAYLAGPKTAAVFRSFGFEPAGAEGGR